MFVYQGRARSQSKIARLPMEAFPLTLTFAQYISIKPSVRRTCRFRNGIFHHVDGVFATEQEHQSYPVAQKFEHASVVTSVRGYETGDAKV